ncbi:MAG: itaconate CoA-transferase [Granulosicoccus sp.]|jgi:crotonobetainyl-CoA:carnitine CoA-transferase CaiB-like acyl-CoA transferase
MQALEGLLVVSIEQAVAAPFCSARLVQAGARVIKIERDEGDFARGYDTAAKGESSYFTWLNQGKESVCLDFKSDEGAVVLWAMLERADVFIQNLSPGAMARAGFSTEKMLAINPRLIICNVSGYGDEGEAAKKRAYDLLVQAESGLISISGAPDAPGRVGVSVCDIGAGMTAYGAVLEALHRRERAGHGELLSVSLFDVTADWMTVPYLHAFYGKGAPKPVGLKHPSIAPYGAFRCSDDRLILISIQNEREWERLCKEVLLSETIFQCAAYGNNNVRVTNRDELEHDITAITSTITSVEFQGRLQQASIAYGAVNTPDDLASHPAFRTQTSRTAEGQELLTPAHPVKRNDSGDESELRSPRLGEHTRSVLNEFAKQKQDF